MAARLAICQQLSEGAGSLIDRFESLHPLPEQSRNAVLIIAVRHEDVTNSPDGLDVAWHGGIGFDQLAQS